MDRLVVQGPSSIRGRIHAAGAKNAALKLMAASLMVDGTTHLHRVPKIYDVDTMAAVLRTLGMRIDIVDDNDLPGVTMSITAGEVTHEAPYELVSKMRASIVVLGPLLGKLGKARVAMPGGCNIGNRKIDLHIKGLEALGARFSMVKGYLEAETDGLKGAEVILDIPSVGATENILMAAVMAEGNSVIENAAREPEIVDLAEFLNASGAKITGAGGTRIEVEGVPSLSGCEYEVVADRIEVGTLLIAAAATQGDIFVAGGRADHLEIVLVKLRDMGCEVTETSEGIGLKGPETIKSVDLVTLPYPGFPTDLQAPMMAILSLSDDVSMITENVFENRFSVVDELNRMGASIDNEGHHAVIRGVKALDGVPVCSPDLRGGAALLIAAFMADGATEIQDISHIDRGYESVEERFNSLGARIERIRPANMANMPSYEIVSE